MKLFDKKSLILLISVVSINVLCIISVSYAYFTAQIKGNEDAKEMTVHAGTMTITYADTNTVSLDNAIPGDSVTKTFKVENTGTLDVKYNIKIDVNTNEFEDYSDLTYILTKNGIPEEEQVLPYEDGYIVVDSEIASTTIDNYSLKVTFKKDESNQNDNANKKVEFTIVVDSEDDIKLYEYKEPYKDNSGANRPKLYQGMIPIRFTEENTMVIADITDTENPWYDYDEHKWGNAVLIDNTNQDIVNKFYNEDGTLKINQTITEEDILQMYVWIPRYKYQLFNAVAGETSDPQEIQIQFEKGVTSTGNVTCEISSVGVETCENAINGNWYTHPAFIFGDTELPGIWIGKFEPSHTTKSLSNVGTDASAVLNCVDDNCNEAEYIRIIPNAASLRYNNISNYFYVSRSIEKMDNIYNLEQKEIDTHMMKNMEWGAMAYLTQSKYGICNFEGLCSAPDANLSWWHSGYSGTSDLWNSEKGFKASTTGNIYGIYDVSGGGWDYVMANMLDTDGISVPGSAGFVRMPNEKYYDKYAYNNSLSDYKNGHLGDATREILIEFDKIENSSWWSTYSRFFSGGSSWFMRGGRSYDNTSAGLFAFASWPGESATYHTFRIVITAKDGDE